MTTTAIAAQTAAAASSSFPLLDTESAQVYASASLRPEESVTLERTPNAGSDWIRVVDDKYHGVVLDHTRNNATVNGPGTFRLVKTVTSETIAVYFD